MRINIECPYCGKEQDVDSEDWPGRDGESEKYECRHCEKRFMICLEVSYDLVVTAAPCLNGGPHRYSSVPFESTGLFHCLKGLAYGKLTIHTCMVCGHEERKFDNKVMD